MLTEVAIPGADVAAGFLRATSLEEIAIPSGFYTFECRTPKPHCVEEHAVISSLLDDAVDREDRTAARIYKARLREMEEVKWIDEIRNLVTSAAKNFLLDTTLSGSAYTAAWYLGLISSAGYTAVAVGDTPASHAGWTESTAYSNATRPAPAFGAASAGSKASSATSFTINATDTIKGAILVSNSTKGGTTGTLYSAGLFTGGDKPVASPDTLQVTYTATMA